MIVRYYAIHLSLHDALPIYDLNETIIRQEHRKHRRVGPYGKRRSLCHKAPGIVPPCRICVNVKIPTDSPAHTEKEQDRSEEHTSELQSLRHLVCRLLLEKKK